MSKEEIIQKLNTALLDTAEGCQCKVCDFHLDALRQAIEAVKELSKILKEPNAN